MAAEANEVKLIGIWASPFVLRVRIALNLKGVDYEMLQETVGKKSEILLKSNPVYKKIPVLIHNGKPVSESMIIVEYIDATWTSMGQSVSLLPSDPYDRSIARFWTAYVDDKVPTAIRTMRGMHPGNVDVAAEQLTASLQLLEEAFLDCSKGKSFFNGESIGYLDIALGSHIGWIKAVEKIVGVRFFDEEKIPGLAAWAERFCAHDSVKEVMPEADKLIEFNSFKKSVLGVAPAK
ncbi:hypothetical protein LUZ60_004326 [Juncus effusus]|nr:hypothetical protein LUZ60_004326 [Juncus effusus]